AHGEHGAPRADAPVCPPAGRAQETPGTGVLVLAPQWRPAECSPSASAAPAFDARVLVLCETPASFGAALAPALADGARIVALRSDERDPAARFASHAARLFALVKDELQVLAKRPRARALLQVVAPASDDAWDCAALAALLKTAAQENPRLVAQWIAFDAWPDAGGVAARLRENASAAGDVDIRYRDGRRHTLRWAQTRAA
ncbi:Rossmann-fold NAD(P)-binding domain-containing protein, partial [Burkholderia thailandensis]